MFVRRDTTGVVRGCFPRLQPGYAEEELPDDHPDVVTFIFAWGGCWWWWGCRTVHVP